MNTYLSEQIKKHIKDLDGIDDSLKKLLEEISKTYEKYEAQVNELEMELKQVQGGGVVNQELMQTAQYQKDIINQLKTAIVALEPNSEILKMDAASSIDEASYLINSLIKLINAHKEFSQKLEVRKIELEKVNKLLEQEKFQLVQEKAKAQSILYAIGDGLIVTDIFGRISIVNQAFTDLLGYKDEEVIGKMMSSIVKKVDKNGIEIETEERLHFLALKTGQAQSSRADKSYYYLRKDGSKFPVKISVAPIVIGGQKIGVVEVFKDVTKEEEINKAKNEFVSLASHQLRTPLSSINWYTEMLIDGGNDKDEMELYLSEIKKARSRMTNIINALLDVSRIELGTIQVETKEVDMVQLIERLIKDQYPDIQKKNIRVHTNFTENLPKVSLDEKYFEMVFQNLLSNAIKYTPENKDIGVEVDMMQNQEGKIIIKVWDTGYGIPENEHEKIFSKLFRASNIKTLDTDGNGLGLYIAKSIIETIGGQIGFKSKLNQGSLFYIISPLKWKESIIKSEDDIKDKLLESKIM